MPRGVTWTYEDVNDLYPWASSLPNGDYQEFLDEINAYVGENHGYDDAWYTLIKQWRTTALCWRDQPVEMNDLVKFLREVNPEQVCLYCQQTLTQLTRGDAAGIPLWQGRNNSVECPSRWVGFHTPRSDSTGDTRRADDAEVALAAFRQHLRGAVQQNTPDDDNEIQGVGINGELITDECPAVLDPTELRGTLGRKMQRAPLRKRVWRELRGGRKLGRAESVGLITMLAVLAIGALVTGRYPPFWTSLTVVGIATFAGCAAIPLSTIISRHLRAHRTRKEQN